MATHVIPGYGAMYEGMGDTIPGFIRLFLNNFMISLAVVILLFGLYLVQHISLAHSFRVARISLIASSTLALLLMAFFWFVCKYPMWLIQHGMDSLPN